MTRARDAVSTRSTWLPLLLVPFLAACSSLFGNDEARLPGLILFDSDEPITMIPDTVEVGEEFAISVETAWPNGCARKGDTEVDSTSDRITVAPYDFVLDADGCTQNVQRFTHSALLRFSQPGDAFIVVQGRAATDAFGVVTFEYLVFVR